MTGCLTEDGRPGWWCCGVRRTAALWQLVSTRVAEYARDTMSVVVFI